MQVFIRCLVLGLTGIGLWSLPVGAFSDKGEETVWQVPQSLVAKGDLPEPDDNDNSSRIVPEPPSPIIDPGQSPPNSLPSDNIVILQPPPTEDAPIDNLEQYFSSPFSGHFGLQATSFDTLEKAKADLGTISQQTGVTPSLIYMFFTPAAKNNKTTSRSESSRLLLASTNLSHVPNALHLLSAADNATKEDQCASATPARPTDPIWQFDTCGWDRLFPKGTLNQATDLLTMVLITSDGTVVRKQVPGATRDEVLRVADRFRGSIADLKAPEIYLPRSQRLYQWLIAPLEKDLVDKKVNNLVFILDKGLRSLPFAALHDGKNFIIERYSVGVMPSLTLSDTRHIDLKSTKVLAMGASDFQDLPALPSVPIELSTITKQLWSGESFLNENFTPDQLKKSVSTQPFGIIHLATHGAFRPGKPENSYIQFWNTKVNLDRLQDLGLTKPENPTSLLVLSACQTALGDQDAELGFTGLAVSAGVQTALGGLWSISDVGTLAFMTGFYNYLKTAPTKAEALRLAQLSMLKGQIRMEEGKLVLDTLRTPLPQNEKMLENIDLRHPFYWSGITMVGNPW